MTDTRPARRYRFGVFEVDSTTGELRRKGVRVKLHSQPFQILLMLLERPGEMLTREEICRELWPDGTFVDYEHGVNSAVNRLRGSDFGGATACSREDEEGISRPGISCARGSAEEFAFRGSDTLRPTAGHVPGLLCRGAGQPGGDQRIILTVAVCRTGLHHHDRDGRASDSGSHFSALRRAI